MTRFEIASLDVGGIPVARLIGELDLASTAGTLDALLDVAGEEGPGLVIDLNELDYVDSAGIRLLVELADRLRSTGRTLAVAVAETAPVSRVLEIVKLDLLVEMARDAASAAALVAAAGDEPAA